MKGRVFRCRWLEAVEKHTNLFHKGFYANPDEALDRMNNYCDCERFMPTSTSQVSQILSLGLLGRCLQLVTCRAEPYFNRSTVTDPMRLFLLSLIGRAVTSIAINAARDDEHCGFSFQWRETATVLGVSNLSWVSACDATDHLFIMKASAQRLCNINLSRCNSWI